jgi:hypothetical protein
MFDPSKWKVAGFATSFTWAVIRWNLVEIVVQDVLVALLGKSTAATATVIEMGSTSLANAVKSAAEDIEDKAVQKNIYHLLEGIERLRAYRNYYIHSIMIMMPKDLGGKIVCGRLMSSQAKGKLKYSEGWVSQSDLDVFIERCGQFINFGRFVITDLTGEDDSLFSEILELSKPSPEKPPLPPKLLKNLRSLLQPVHLPPTSQV